MSATEVDVESLVPCTLHFDKRAQKMGGDDEGLCFSRGRFPSQLRRIDGSKKDALTAEKPLSLSAQNTR